MSGEIVIELKYPLGNGFDKLRLRRPKVRDMLAADKAKGSDAEKEITMFANLCELAPIEIESLDMADYQALQKAYQDFLS